jgi:hypothetical protein
LNEHYDDESERNHREAGLPGLPWTSKSFSGYSNSQEAHAASRSRNTLTREESKRITLRVDRFRQEQMKLQREADERRGSDIVINLEALPANIRIVYERFMTTPVDGEDAYNSFVEYFDFQRNRFRGALSIHYRTIPMPYRDGRTIINDFLIAVEQYRMRALMVPDTATNAMNLVLRNLAVAHQLGLEYINPGVRHFHDGLITHSVFASDAAIAVLARSRVGPSLTVSDARAMLAINDTVEVTVDVVEAAFERDAAIMFAEGERYVRTTHEPITALTNLRQARSLLLRKLE